MKVLWTISNWKHTGPVQPSLDLAAALLGLGHDVRVAVGLAPTTDHPEADIMREERRVPAADVWLRLGKHAFFGRDLPDARRLAAWLRRERPDVVVTTLANDHRIAQVACRKAGGPPVVRLLFADGEEALPERDARALVDTPAVITFGGAAAESLRSCGIEATRIHALGAPLDVAGLCARAPDRDRARARLDLAPETFVLGIVARLQRHRRYELLWDAVAALDRAGAPVHVLVLGRGTYIEEVGHRPVRDRGLERRVTFGGYRKGRDYLAGIRAMDAQLLLVPGSDPTCRALREGQALGVPSLATQRGMLPSIVTHGETGLLFEENVDGLVGAVERLRADPEATRRMGAAAARHADEHYAAPRVAAELARILESVTGGVAGA